MNNNSDAAILKRRKRIIELVKKAEKVDSDSDDSDNLEEVNSNKIIGTMIYTDSQNSSVEYKVPFDTALDSANEALGLTEEMMNEYNIPNNSVAYNTLTNGPLFYRLTNMQPCEFVELVKQLEPDYTNIVMGKAVEEGENEAINSRKFGRINSRKLACYDALLLYLMLLDGPSFAVLALIFDISVSSVFDYAEYMGKLINNGLKAELHWPNEEERKQLYGLIPTYDRAVGLIDGTHCKIRVPRSVEEEKNYFSGYKWTHTQNYLVVVDLNGFIIYLDGGFEGSGVDVTACNDTDLFNNSENYFSAGERLLADGGFKGDYPNLIIPFRSDEIDSFMNTEEAKNNKRKFNDIHTNTRSKVEHAIHRIKSVASSLAQRYTRDKKRQTSTMISAVLLFNWTRRHRIEKQLIDLDQ
jgi:hypothetical protein